MFAYFACITCLCLKFYSGNFNHHHHYNHHHYHYRHHHWCHCHCQILNLFNLTIKTKYHTLMIQKIYDFCHFCFYYHYDHHYHYHHHHWCHCHCQILNLFDLTIKTRYHGPSRIMNHTFLLNENVPGHTSQWNKDFSSQTNVTSQNLFHLEVDTSMFWHLIQNHSNEDKNKSYVDVTLVIGVKLGYNIKSKHNF